VFYGKVESATADGYHDFDETNFSKKRGFLYSFTGLRGDAKRLYRKINKGEEKRVQLVQAKTPADQAIYVENADLVIVACGFQTGSMIIKDQEGKHVDL
jgi:hypothetical protein